MKCVDWVNLKSLLFLQTQDVTTYGTSVYITNINTL